MITPSNPPHDSFLVDYRSSNLREQFTTLQVTVTEVGKASSYCFCYSYYSCTLLQHEWTEVVSASSKGCPTDEECGPAGLISVRSKSTGRTGSSKHIPIGLLFLGIGRSDCLVSKASDFVVATKFHCISIAANRWYRGNMSPSSPEDRRFDSSWGRSSWRCHWALRLAVPPHGRPSSATPRRRSL